MEKLMSLNLQQYVRQVKPRNESYTPPVDKIQSFLAEASMPAADWEKVICVAYNMKSGISEEEAVQAAEIDEWKPKHQAGLPSGHEIVKNAFSSTEGNMIHFGSGNSRVTSEWDDYFIKATGKPAGGPTLTPKTDMRLSNANISLKKYGGSQLMSGGKAETLATLGFAYDNAPDSIKSEAFDKAWDQLQEDIVEKYVAFKLPPGGQAGKIASGKQKVDKKMKDLVIDSMTKHKAMTNVLLELFQSPGIKKEVVREAMSGREKFADKKAAATHMMKFDPTGKAEYIAIDDKLVSKYTNATSFNISFKTSGTGKRAWTALKGIYKEETVNLDDILEESAKETDKEFLEEGIFSRAVKSIKTWFVRFLKKVWEKIKKLIMKSLDIALNLFGKQMVARGDGYSFGGF